MASYFAFLIEQDLQKALEGTRLGMKHKESEIEVSKLDKERLLGKLRADEGNFATSYVGIVFANVNCRSFRPVLSNMQPAS